jgi:zinc protease
MRPLLAALLLLPLLAVRAGAQDAAPIYPFETHVRDLANGLRVVVVPTGLPDVVAVQIVLGTGSRNEVEPGKSGFAHFFEHMMFRGTEAIPAALYQDILKRAGGDQNAYTSADRTVYHTTFLKESLDEILRIEADRFQNLAYSDADFRTEARAVLGEYNKNFANPVQRLFEAQAAAAYRVHPYQHTTMGFLADIEDMPNQYDYSRTFFRRYYRPENAVLLIAGDVDPADAFARAERHFGPWARGFDPAEVPAEPPPAGPVATFVPWDGPTPPWLTVAFRGPAAFPTPENPAAGDMQALDVLATLAFGPSSDLYRRLVIEEQVVDAFGASFPDSRDPGLLTLYARVTDPADVARVRDEIQRELARWRVHPPDAARLDELKRALRYGFAASMDNTKGIADALVPYLAVTRDPATLEAVYATYAAITPEQVRAAADRYFVDQGMVVVSLAQGALDDEALRPGSVDAHLAAAREAVADAGTAAAPPATPEATPRAAARESATPRFREALRPSASPLIDLQLRFESGAASDPAGQPGLAELTARMLADAGSRAMTYAEIQAAFFPIAAGLGVQVDKEATTFEATIHRDNAAAFFDIVAGMLLDPGFREDDFARVKQNLVAEIRTSLRAGNDEELGKEVLYESLYAGHPYGTLTRGHAAAVEELLLDDVRAFYRSHYTQDRLTLALAGGFTDDLAADLRAALAARLPASGAAFPDVQHLPRRAERRATLVAKPETRAAAISMGFPLEVTRSHPDFVALDLVRSWLGEHRNSSAHLFQRIREVRGMNYGDYAYAEYFPDGMFRTMPAAGLARRSQLFQIWVRPVPPEHAHFATRLALYELDTLVRDGLSEADFEATRAFLRNYAALLTATQGRRLGYELDQTFYGLPDFVTWYRAELDRLTLDDVNRALREHLRSDGMEIVVVTPQAEELAEAFTTDRPSPMTYASPKADEVYVEDAVVQGYPLGLSADRVRVIPAETVFEGLLPRW